MLYIYIHYTILYPILGCVICLFCNWYRCTCTIDKGNKHILNSKQYMMLILHMMSIYFTMEPNIPNITYLMHWHLNLIWRPIHVQYLNFFIDPYWIITTVPLNYLRLSGTALIGLPTAVPCGWYHIDKHTVCSTIPIKLIKTNTNQWATAPGRSLNYPRPKSITYITSAYWSGTCISLQPT